MADFPFDLSKLDFSSILDMAKKLKEQMSALEQTLAKVYVEATVGGGMVTVKANGKGELVAIVIEPELLAMNDKAMLENLILAGANRALADAKARRDEEMQKLTGGLALPGWFA